MISFSNVVTRNRGRQSGNVFFLILVGVILFGLLGFTFSRSANKGTGNLTKQQAKIAAQELFSFFNLVDSAYNKLRMKGCSESDISFSNNADSGPFIGQNNSPTAPLDRSCHIFDDNGGKVTFNMDWRKYQVPVADFPCCAIQDGQIYFKINSSSIVGLGTPENEIQIHLNFVHFNICEAYNNILDIDVDMSVNDLPPVLGDENPTYIGLQDGCIKQYLVGGENHQIRHVLLAK